MKCPVNVCITADRKWYIYRKLSTPCPRGSVIKRLSLYEFAPKGRDFVSVVRIRDGPYYRGFFLEEMYENFVGT